MKKVAIIMAGLISVACITHITMKLAHSFIPQGRVVAITAATMDASADNLRAGDH